HSHLALPPQTRQHRPRSYSRAPTPPAPHSSPTRRPSDLPDRHERTTGTTPHERHTPGRPARPEGAGATAPAPSACPAPPAAVSRRATTGGLRGRIRPPPTPPAP